MTPNQNNSLAISSFLSHNNSTSKLPISSQLIVHFIAISIKSVQLFVWQFLTIRLTKFWIIRNVVSFPVIQNSPSIELSNSNIEAPYNN